MAIYYCLYFRYTLLADYNVCTSCIVRVAVLFVLTLSVRFDCYKYLRIRVYKFICENEKNWNFFWFSFSRKTACYSLTRVCNIDSIRRAVSISFKMYHRRHRYLYLNHRRYNKFTRRWDRNEWQKRWTRTGSRIGCLRTYKCTRLYRNWCFIKQRHVALFKLTQLGKMIDWIGEKCRARENGERRWVWWILNEKINCKNWQKIVKF